VPSRAYAGIALRCPVTAVRRAGHMDTGQRAIARHEPTSKKMGPVHAGPINAVRRGIARHVILTRRTSISVPQSADNASHSAAALAASVALSKRCSDCTQVGTNGAGHLVSNVHIGLVPCWQSSGRGGIAASRVVDQMSNSETSASGASLSAARFFSACAVKSRALTSWLRIARRAAFSSSWALAIAPLIAASRLSFE
jgi:hypothetical protein